MAKTPQTRKEATSVRLEPKIKYLVEVAARIQRRSVTNYIEWALEESLKEIPVTVGEKKSNLLDMSDLIWSTNEATRFIALAYNFNDLLSFEEQKVWEVIRQHPFIFSTNPTNDQPFNYIDIDAIQELWSTVNSAAADDPKAIQELKILNKKGKHEKLDLPIQEVLAQIEKIEYASLKTRNNINSITEEDLADTKNPILAKKSIDGIIQNIEVTLDGAGGIREGLQALLEKYKED